MFLARSFFLSFFGIIFSCGASASSIEWESKIKYIDADVLSREKNVGVEFYFTNNGTGVFKITSLVASCGCLVPSVIKKEYSPGETGHIFAMYNGVGPKRSNGVKLYVQSNNGDDILDVKVVKKRFASLSPDEIAWTSGTLINEQTKTSTLILEKDGVIKSLTSSEPEFRTSWEEQASKREFLIKVTPGRSSMPKRGLINITVAYADDNTETLALLVKVQ